MIKKSILKEHRHKIYSFLESEGFTFNEFSKKSLSIMLQKYVKMYNEVLLKEITQKEHKIHEYHQKLESLKMQKERALKETRRLRKKV